MVARKRCIILDLTQFTRPALSVLALHYKLSFTIAFDKSNRVSKDIKRNEVKIGDRNYCRK